MHKIWSYKKKGEVHNDIRTLCGKITDGIIKYSMEKKSADNVSIIFIAFKNTISEPIYANFIIKGVYSCFIALLVYDFFYVITLTGLINKLEDYKYDEIEDWLKNCGYASSILIGLINIGLSVFLKEIVLGIVNLLMYIGMVTAFFKINKDRREALYDNDGIGVMHIIMMILSLASIAFVFIKYKPFNLKY